MSESSRLPARYGERGGVSDAAGGTPPSTDVLAAQVRAPFALIAPHGMDSSRSALYAAVHEAEAALDALVARIKNAEMKSIGLFDDLHEAETRVRDLVARVTEAERREHGLNDDWLAASERAAKAEAALADARNALEGAKRYARTVDLDAAAIQGGYPHVAEVLARLDGNQP